MTYVDLDYELSESIRGFFFSGGEPHVNVPQYSGDVSIVANVNTWEDFGELLCVLSAIDSQPDVKLVMLYIPYFPGARQDRNPDGRTPLTVGIYASAIAGTIRNKNYLIYSFDLHSDRAHDIIESSLFVNGQFFNIEVDQLDKSVFDDDIIGIICPDAGAKNRATLFRDTHFPKADLLQFEKVRVFENGHITSYEPAETPMIIKPGKYLVVDDICDGGKTFVLLAERLAQLEPEAELQLYVSHGIFSKTPEVLEDHYTKIYTTNSFPHPFYETDYPSVVEFLPPNPFLKEMVNVL